MARPIKKGLDYYPLDVGFLQDIKIKKIMRACGNQSIAILISLLSSIYRDDGYYVLWDEDMSFLVADEVGASEGAVLEVVKKAVQVDFFDKNIFENHKVLTSEGIQKRFLEAASRRKSIDLIEEYLLIDLVNDYNNLINVNINSINANSNTQSKEKESKEKESKEKESKEKESKEKESKEKERRENKLSSPISPIYSQIINLWNSKDKLPKIKTITEARVKHIEERLQEHDLDTILEVIERCANSKFLCGQNKRNWIVTFDWLFGNSENFLKVLEGNYDDKKKKFTVPEWYKDYEANLELSSKQDGYSDEERQKIVEEAKEFLGAKYDFSN